MKLFYELIGAIPGDTETQHSEPSAITLHQDQRVPDLAAAVGEVQFGPV